MKRTDKSDPRRKGIGDDSRLGLVIAGRYRITERIAIGGMGIVYKGERVALSRPVAIKFLLDPFAQSPQFLARLEREAMAMSQLSHPNCVSVIDFGVEGVPYIVMDYVVGKTLRNLLNEGPMPVGRAIHISKQLLAGLAHAHNQGIVHRDVKPGNVMISEATGMGDHVRIFDFGLAKLLDSESQMDLSRTNVAMGTPAYMSPEQTVGGAVDARSDLYSTGLLLFELLTDRKPFAHDDALRLMQMQRETPPPRLAMAAPNRTFSYDLEDVIAKALAKKPAARFQTAREFADALAAVPESQISYLTDDTPPPRIGTPSSRPSIAPRPEQRKSSTPPPVRGKRRAPAIVATVTTLVGFAGTAWLVATAPRGGPLPEANVAAVALEAVDQPTRVDTVHMESDSAQNDTGGSVSTSTGEAGLHPENATSSPKVESKTETSNSTDSAQATSLQTGLELLKAQEFDKAIAVLQKARRSDPEDPVYPFTLAQAYFGKKRYWACLEQYRIALRIDPALRDKAVLNENLIAMLGEDDLSSEARNFVIQEIGQAALPHLQQAAEKAPNAEIRKRAAALAGEVSSLNPQ